MRWILVSIFFLALAAPAPVLARSPDAARSPAARGLSPETSPAATGAAEILRAVPALGDLRRLAGAAGDMVFLKWHQVPGDGGGGYFRWESGKRTGFYKDNNGTVIVPAGGNGSAAWVRENAGEINVRWFGARGDGATDDGPAINAAVDFLRSRIVAGGPEGEHSVDARLLIPPGRYYIGTGINMTGIRQAWPWFVEARGAVLLGHTRGKAVVDLIGSRSCSWLGGHIIGDAKDRPLAGVQIGRTETTTADNHTFNDLSVTGFYTRASLYNYASEGSFFAHLRLINLDPSPGSYALIQDGNAADFAPVSDYQTIRAPGAASFNENFFVRPDVRKPNGGPAVYMSRTSRHTYLAAYFVSVNDAAVVLKSDAFGHKQLHLDLHSETAAHKNFAGLQQVIRFEGSPVQTISGLLFRENSSHALEACFKAGAGVRSVTIEDADIHIAGFRGGVFPARGVFADPSAFRVVGSVSLPEGTATGLDTGARGGAAGASSEGTFTMPERLRQFEDVEGRGRAPREGK